MNILFSDKKLEEVALDHKAFKKQYGEQIAKAFYRRIADLRAITTIAELYQLAGKHHPLKGNMYGMWACSLTANYRLLYTPNEEEIVITIIEIRDYH